MTLAEAIAEIEGLRDDSAEIAKRNQPSYYSDIQMTRARTYALALDILSEVADGDRRQEPREE